MSYSFFATVSRMKYIDRWALMRNAREENLSEHSLEVAMIAHALCIIGNKRYGKSLNAEKAALIGLYHDASEIITGDMPTPVKYRTSALRRAYKEVEGVAEDQLLRMLPEDLRDAFAGIFSSDEQDVEEQYLRRLVKAADKFSALIKCMEEKEAGNLEFRTAELSTRESIEKMSRELPEVRDFLIEFLPSYGNTLDELIGKDD
ncbi:MAG: 5'-deoxynucleotidase [Lachnospiraceae bacterium]|nr:5'-deoxynucleotidase [Lachnospiraceae bacterium]